MLINKIHEETPPHAWGRLEPSSHESWLDGNTPTCVGKTKCGLTLIARNEKHPHMRGEDLGI